MLAIRLQRTGRSGHTQFRVIVQDDRFSPKSGRVTAYVGSYDPHTKAAIINKDEITKYLNNGAQPSDRVAKLLQKEGLKLPDWVKLDGQKQRTIRNPEKLRRNSPAGEPAPTPIAETPVEESTAEQAAAEPVTEEPQKTSDAADETTEPVAENTGEAEPAEETPAEESQEKTANKAKTDEPEPSA